MAPPKRRRTEDTPYMRPGKSYDQGDAILGWRQRTAMHAQPSVQPATVPRVLSMEHLPAATVHKYLLRYNLLPNYPRPILTYCHAAEPVPPLSLAYLAPRKRPFPEAWYENAPPGPTMPIFPGQPVIFPTAAEETEKEKENTQVHAPQCEEFKEPAFDGQEPDEADGRLCEIAAKHWDNVILKEGETIVNFFENAE